MQGVFYLISVLFRGGQNNKMKYILGFISILLVFTSIGTTEHETVVTGTHNSVPCAFEDWETVYSPKGEVISSSIVGKRDYCPCYGQ